MRTAKVRLQRWSRQSRQRGTSAPPSNTCRSLARDHAAPESTLVLTKASSLGCGRVRPLAWCSRPRSSAALLEGALDGGQRALAGRFDERGEDERAVRRAEERIDGVLGMRHQAHHVPPLVDDARNVISRTVDRLRIAQHDLAPSVELVVEGVVGVPAALTVLDRNREALPVGAA